VVIDNKDFSTMGHTNDPDFLEKLKTPKRVECYYCRDTKMCSPTVIAIHVGEDESKPPEVDELIYEYVCDYCYHSFFIHNITEVDAPPRIDAGGDSMDLPTLYKELAESEPSWDDLAGQPKKVQYNRPELPEPKD
jgi:hypothetical protein